MISDMLTLSREQAAHLRCVLADSLWSLERRRPSPATDDCIRVVAELRRIVESFLSKEVSDGSDLGVPGMRDRRGL
jgi:hypothetical protein